MSAAPLRFDTARLEAYLAANAKGFEGPLSVKQFRGGQSNPTYYLETPARKYVLRRKPPGKLLPSAHAVDREFKVISALYAQGFPVAEPVVYCADESVTGTAFYVMGFVEGRVIWVPEMPDSNPAERTAVFDAMNATLGAAAFLRALRDRALGLRQGRELRRAPGRPLVEAIPRLRDREDRRDGAHHGVAAGASAAARAGAPRARRLPARQHDPASERAEGARGARLGAFHAWAIRSPTSPITACSGTCRIRIRAPAPARWSGIDLKALGIPSLSDYVDAYVARTGLDPRPYLAVYSAYNFFRLAAILQGIVGRVRDGTATNENAPARAQMVRPLAATAWEFAQQAGAK